MKKLLMIAVVAIGSLGFVGAHADPPPCTGPVTVGPCTYSTPLGGEKTCGTLWVQVGVGQIDGCVIN
ncbi:MAG: hypothetical protein ACYDCC_10900 [Actinomycetota bacterium]